MPQAITAGGSEPQESSSSWNARSVPPRSSSHRAREAQHLALAEQVAHRLAGLLRVAPALQFRLAAVHGRLAHQEVHRLVQAHAAQVELDVDDDAAGAPDLVVEAHEAHDRVVEEPLPVHELLAVEGPALHQQVAAVRQAGDATRERGRGVGAHELQVVARVRLVHSRGAQRGGGVPAQDGAYLRLVEVLAAAA